MAKEKLDATVRSYEAKGYQVERSKGAVTFSRPVQAQTYQIQARPPKK